ncbi:substrate-binding periplasmic protein [Bowmanella dokdonensis]|uniref:Transporter substrate-binding domain-containing protein n=1 Tax=Bowmanella dokdonensis TaxID=751969 RepID=A0A939DMX2_9ALTE|nr:transporter substrate-binding domain-containing protein [Bowmanella dokdonensis]MBN7825055.1 transporter substrate-binding domain-containing protein [Bowmanella dokdonensis]
MKQLVLIMLLFTSVCLANADRPLRIGLHYSAPWAYADEAGQLTGIDYQMVTRIFEQAGYQVRVEVFSHERLVQKFHDKELDYASPMAFEVPGAYPTMPYMPIQDVAVSRRSARFKLDDLQDLQGKAVVAYQKASDVLGPIFASLVEDGGYLEMADRAQQFTLLFNDRVDLVVGDRKVLEYFSEKHYGAGRLRIHPIFPTVTYPGATWDKRLTDLFNQGLRQLKESGEYQQLLEKDWP